MIRFERYCVITGPNQRRINPLNHKQLGAINGAGKKHGVKGALLLHLCGILYVTGAVEDFVNFSTLILWYLSFPEDFFPFFYEDSHGEFPI